MKKALMLLTLFAGFALFADDNASAAAAAPVPDKAPVTAAAPAAAPAAVEDDEPGVALCLARGVCNIATGCLEIPRCMIYDNGFMPIFGLIVGIPEGACLTVARELCGVYDLLSFGMSGSTFHGKVFPDTVFTAKWIYHRD